MLYLYYSAIGIIAIIVHIILNHVFYQNKAVDRDDTRDYKRFLVAVFVYYLSDVAWGFLHEYSTVELLYIDTVVYNIAMVLTVLCCCKYVISFLHLNNAFGKALYYFGMFLVFAVLLLLTINHFTGLSFSFDAGGDYHPTFYRYVCMIVLIVMFLTLTVAVFVISKHQKESEVRRRCITIGLFGLTMTSALIAQTLYPLLPLYSVGIMLGTLEIHVFILTEEKNKQIELASAARHEAEVANKAKTSFLFNMSHDIRTPMNAIIGFCKLLKEHQEDPAKREDYLQKIEDSSNVLLSIINNVLQMARIEKGNETLAESNWDSEEFNDSLFSVFSEMMEQKGITFTRQINVQHKNVVCDSVKLREIFLNVLSNAYKYTNPGGRVNMELKEVPCDKEGYAMYQTTISDTGIGMSEEFLPHLFEEFTRERSSTETKIEGTGLGMPIVKRLVALMNGTIVVKSKKGEGTTFIITIPHKIVEDEVAENTNFIESDPSCFVGKRILLAEDNELNAEIAIEVLKEMGFLVERVEDGVECVKKIENAEDGYFDMILMDVQMPRMNGYEATRAIRNLKNKQKSRILILAMTANAFEEDKREAVCAGMDGHLSKPLDIAEMAKVLTCVIKL